jgi:hypothetical protein
LPPHLDYPALNSSGVELRPTFKWHDGGTGDAAADSYSIEITPVKAGAQPQFTQAGITATQWTPPADLLADTEYGWSVIAHNAAGSGTAASGFTTGHPAKPLPPPPVLDAYDKNTSTLTGHNFLPNHQITVRLSMVGSYVPNNSGVNVPDTREWIDATHYRSDAQGKISVVIDPKKALNALVLDQNPDGTVNFLTGVASNETMIFTANDLRPVPTNIDITGVLWTPPLNVRA